MKNEMQLVKLNEVCDFQNGFAFKSNTYKENGLPIIRITNIQNDEIDISELVFFDKKDYKVNLDRFRVYRGDLLIAMSGATTGKLGINYRDEEFYLNQRVGKFIPKKYLDKRFLYYFLTTKVEESLKIAAGAAQPNLSTEQINDFKIPLPALPEQKRIVSIIDKAFAAIDKAKANTGKNLKNVGELFENHFQNVFENKGNGWEEAKLGDLAEFRNGMNFTKSSKGEKIKIVGVRDFQDNFWVPFEELESVIIDGKLNEIDALCTNDIIAVRSNGNPALIGRTMLTGEVNEKVAHSGFAIRIRLISIKTISPVYLCRFLKTQSTRRKLVEQGNGVGIKSLNQGSLSSLAIYFPKELTEQQKIVRQLDILHSKAQQLQVLYQKKIADLDEMKKSILRKAFNGELN